MRHVFVFITLLALSAFSFGANAQTDSTGTAQTDSVRALDEVSVTASHMIKVKNGLIVLPPANIKRHSRDGNSLLHRLMIPTLRYGNVVTNSLGEPVKYFIDSIPASESQVQGLRGKDVLRVEVLDNPTNACFEGARAVVNYVTHKWVYGGYTTLTAMQGLPRPEGRYELYSKLTMGRSTIELSGYDRWHRYKGSESVTTETLRFPPEIGTLLRTSSTKIGKMKGNYYKAGLKWTYRISDASLLSLDAGFGGEKQPEQESTGTVSYDRPGYESLSSIDRTKSSSNYPSVSARYQHNFKSGAYLSAVLNYGSSFNTSDRHYTLSGTDTRDVTDNVKERNHSYSGTAIFSNPLRKGKDRLTLSLAGGQTFYRSDYTGSANMHSAMNEDRFSADASYYRALSDSWNGEITLTGTLNHNKILGDTAVTVFLPMIRLSANGSLGPKSRLGFNGSIYRNSNTASSYNPVRRQLTEIFGTAGNPEVGNTMTYSLGMSYTLMASKSVSINASANYSYQHNTFMSTYLPYEGVMYKTDNTMGNLTSFSSSVSSQISLLKGFLYIMPTLSLSHTHLNGTSRINVWYFSPNTWVTWYPNYDWSISIIAGQNVGRQYEGSGAWYRSRPKFDLTISTSYVKGNWFIDLMLANLMNKKWRTNAYMHSEYVDRHTYTIMGMSNGITAQLTVSYSFDYGKRVNRGNRYNPNAQSISNVR